MTVLVVGSGGREHALALAISKDPAVAAVHVAPGNPGTAGFATNHPVDILDGPAVAALAVDLGVDLVVVGPEAPLVAGVADAVRSRGVACFGPGAAAARLEGSKSFAKQVMADAGVPTARSRVATTPEQAAAALDEFGAPHVVKADGLAAGKGVVVTSDRQAALDHAAECGQVVIEEYLDGPEASLFVITDGTTAVPLPPAQDFKRVGDGDEGPNTGGMGSYTPLPWLPDGTVEQVMAEVVEPTLARMRDLGTPFTGLLYVGLALTKAGPLVVEFNARFGDPETEAILPRLDTGLGVLLHAAATGALAEQPPLDVSDRACVGVVLAAKGYPATPVKGCVITLPGEPEGVHVIHAGTALDDQGRLVAAGGRVLVVVATGADIADARERAYAHIGQIDFADGFARSDIASKDRLDAIAARLGEDRREQ
ncbi:phosphoribosylamine--glycine ligase [Propionibacterium australiense]|uniref:Phosphoribosylamine--glycine ligase n=1 Tax=Propionibacterium australiense TaxID=119981 RepID=A0A8B3FLW8_9ACTN|nr:phosphoribosylamine--glycine ligase [Propionibacterium australiense]RLP09036.1 phosphoribosylamine--glycine ligase [Propionibacterium australiense]RLP09131.1 phosphoribosylamine--glycine ligase [Propionibacterium australiense]